MPLVLVPCIYPAFTVLPRQRRNASRRAEASHLARLVTYMFRCTQVLDTAYEKGCRFWDTADMYGDNEELLGRWYVEQ